MPRFQQTRTCLALALVTIGAHFAFVHVAVAEHLRNSDDEQQSSSSDPQDQPSNAEPEDDLECDFLNRLVFGCRERRARECCVSASGWLNQGFTWNPDRPTNRFNGPVLQNDRSNEYQLNQLYCVVENSTDADSSDWFGYRADIIYGTDAFFFQSLGLDDKIVSDSSSRFYKLAFPRLYAEMHVPIGGGITVQVGKWFALVGYESGLGGEDFFYSKPIGFNITPYSHTGVLCQFSLSDQIETSHGIHRGSDVLEDNNNALSYTGAVDWVSQNECVSAGCAVLIGPEQDERADFQDLDGAPGPDAPGESLARVLASAYLELQLTGQLRYVLAHDFAYQDGSQRFGIGQAEAYGFTQYLFYDCHEDVSLGARFEVLRDDDGFAAVGFRSESSTTAALYSNLTLAMHYRATRCVTLRPEIRWDWQHRDDPTSPGAFDGGRDSNQFLMSLDVLWRF